MEDSSPRSKNAILSFNLLFIKDLSRNLIKRKKETLSAQVLEEVGNGIHF